MIESPTNGPLPITEFDLHGYLDGELSLDRRAEVEAYLADNPDEAARVAEFRNLTLTLHRLFDTAAAPENPHIDALTEDFACHLRRGRMVRRLVGVAAAVAILATAAVLASGVHDRFRQAEDRFLAFTQQATNAHLLFAGNTLVPARAEPNGDSTVVSWLSQRLTGVPVRSPDLSSLGYALTVERILPSENGPTAQLMYESEKDSSPVTLFIGKSKDKRQSAFTYVQNDDLSIFYWQEGPFAYSLAGNLDRTELLALAEEVNAQLVALPPMPAPIPRSLVQRRAGESTQAAEKGSVAGEKSLGAMPAVSAPGTAAADTLVKPVSKKDDALPKETAPVSESPGAAKSKRGDAIPVDADGKAPVAPIPGSETDASKKT